MIRIIQVLQLILSTLMVLLVLIQSKGKGLSGALTGSGGFYGSRRGLEKIVFILTIVVAVSIVVNSLLIIYLS